MKERSRYENHTVKNDKTLVELTLLGDEPAYDELVDRHQRSVLHILFSRQSLLWGLLLWNRSFCLFEIYSVELTLIL